MAYADYDYYKTVYMGKEIAAGDFPRLSARASSYLDSISAVADRPGDDAVRMAVCAVAEAWQCNESGGDVVSESVGSWSRSFSTGNKTNESRLMDAARVYLGPAGLMRTVEWA